MVPILFEQTPGILRVVGTGCYVARYGLVLTAAHVLAETKQGDGIGPSFVFHLGPEDKIYLRRIQRVFWLNDRDLGIAQVENYLDSIPNDPLINHRARLSTRRPGVGEPLVTYAYPENALLDFNDPPARREVHSDYYSGHVVEPVGAGERPFIPYPHLETSIEIRSGASGGPVFSHDGCIVGIASRGWDFKGGEEEQEPLSSVVLIEDLLHLGLTSWRFPQRLGRLNSLWANLQLAGGKFASYASLATSFSTERTPTNSHPVLTGNRYPGVNLGSAAFRKTVSSGVATVVPSTMYII